MYFCKLGIPHRDGTAWLGMRDSNSEMSAQIIPLKGRGDFRGPAEFWPQRLFAFELRRWEAQLGPSARISAGCLRWQELPQFSADAEMIRRERVPRIDHHGFARSALAATSLETVHFGPEYCRRALSPEEGGEWGDGNERTGDEASSRRERSETADGRRNPGHGKGSGSRREDSLQGRGGHNRDRMHLALERVLIIRVARQAPADVRFALLRGRREDILEVRVHAIS